MELKKITKKIKCDMPGCKNLSDYAIGHKKYLVGGNFYFCKDCLNAMYTTIGKVLVPQSIKHIYKKKNESKE